MTRQIESLSQLGLLSQFVGMRTDSRSFLSYTRHEYFRRLLCNILGDDIERGGFPNDLSLVGKMVEDISYHNARRFFGFYDKKQALRILHRRLAAKNQKRRRFNDLRLSFRESNRVGYCLSRTAFHSSMRFFSAAKRASVGSRISIFSIVSPMRMESTTS